VSPQDGIVGIVGIAGIAGMLGRPPIVGPTAAASEFARSAAAPSDATPELNAEILALRPEPRPATYALADPVALAVAVAARADAAALACEVIFDAIWRDA
jgi:hypothetical protein